MDFGQLSKEYRSQYCTVKPCKHMKKTEYTSPWCIMTINHCKVFGIKGFLNKLIKLSAYGKTEICKVKNGNFAVTFWERFPCSTSEEELYETRYHNYIYLADTLEEAKIISSSLQQQDKFLNHTQHSYIYYTDDKGRPFGTVSIFS